MIAPTTEKESTVSRSTATLLSPVSPPNERSETVELVARDNAIPPRSRAKARARRAHPPTERAEPVGLAARAKATPPRSSAKDSASSAQPSHEAARERIPPIPRPCSFVPSVTTQLYRAPVPPTAQAR